MKARYPNLSRWEKTLAASCRLFKKGYGPASVARKLEISFKKARQLQKIYMQAEADANARYAEREEIRAMFKEYYECHLQKAENLKTADGLYEEIARANVEVTRRAEFLLLFFPTIVKVFMPLPNGGLAEWIDDPRYEGFVSGDS